MKPKILIIGLDGATFDIIYPLIEKGLLPHMEKVIKEGIHGELHSTIHPITPQAWSSFLTGKNAGKHAVYDFMRRKADTYDIELINAGKRKADSIFLYLSELGMKVGSVAVPFTYPPEKVNGYMFSGFDAPAEDERSVFPKELFDEVCEKFGHYYIHLASPVGRIDDEDLFWRDIQIEDKNRTDISIYLLKNHPAEIFMTMYNNIDRVQHQYLTYDYLELVKGNNLKALKENILTKTYINVDREMGRILNEVDENTTIMFMSDHGSGPIKRVFFLNHWLEKHGYLYYKKTQNVGFHFIDKIREMSKRKLPRPIKSLIKSIFPGFRDKVESYRYFSNIDWKKTRAYGFGMYGNICINLEGREPLGIVPPQNFDAICTEISEKLQNLSDPDTGENLINRMYRKEELYNGPFTDQAPDLIMGWKDYSYYTATSAGREDGTLFGKFLKIDSSDFDHVGTHRVNGIYAACGKNIKKERTIKGAHIIDVAPTILFALDKPIPNDIDGKVLSEIFTSDFTKNRTIKFTDSHNGTKSGTDSGDYDESEQQKVEERLKGLGYM